MRFLTLLALVLLGGCADPEQNCAPGDPISFPEIY